MVIDRSADEFKALYNGFTSVRTFGEAVVSLQAQRAAWLKWQAAVNEVNQLARGWAVAPQVRQAA